MYVTEISTPDWLLLLAIALVKSTWEYHADSSLHVAENPLFSPTLLHIVKYDSRQWLGRRLSPKRVSKSQGPPLSYLKFCDK